MKSVSTELDNHLQLQTTTVATCWEITRNDGQVFRFTDHDKDIEFEGNRYYSKVGYTRSAVVNDSSMSVDNLEVQGIVDSELLKTDELRAGLFDHAEVRIFLLNYKDLSQGIMRLRRGWLGEVTFGNGGVFRTELRGMTQALSQVITELYSPECRADLGDNRCKVNINPPILGRSESLEEGDYYRVPETFVDTEDSSYTQDAFNNRIFRVTTAGVTAASQPVYDFTVGNSTNDGTAVLIAEEAWMRHAVISSVTDRKTFQITITEPRAVDDWFNYGALIFETSDNAGFAIEIKDWDQSLSKVTLFLPTPYIPEVGTKVKLYAGCDKRLDTCRSKFENTINFRGEPFVPGPDRANTYADPK